jgi:hypothetical protein
MRDKCEIIKTNGFSIIRRITLLLVILNINITVLYGTESIWVRPFDIKFNYETGQTNDALTIRKADGTAITNPEWASYYNEDENENFAYIISQSNRKIQARFDSNCEDMHLVIKLTVISGTGIGEICNLFVCNYHQLDEVTLTLNGTLPGTVGKRTFTWQWEIYGIPVDDPDFCADWETTESTHTYYTLLTTPQSPMAEPWSSVLDYACVWANGQTTESSIVRYITEGAYNNSGKMYWGGGSHAVYPNFDLTGYFAQNWADCRDMSAVVQIFSNALGVQNVLVRRINGPFNYKSILPVGGSTWLTGTWNFHQVGYYNNVFDACLKLNQSSPRIPINESINSTYKNDLFNSGYWIVNDPATYSYIY